MYIYCILCIFDYRVLNLNYNVSFIEHTYTTVPTATTTFPTANTNATAAIVPTNTTTADTSVATTVGRGHPPLPGGLPGRGPLPGKELRIR